MRQTLVHVPRVVGLVVVERPPSGMTLPGEGPDRDPWVRP